MRASVAVRSIAATNLATDFIVVLLFQIGREFSRSAIQDDR